MGSALWAHTLSTQKSPTLGPSLPSSHRIEALCDVLQSKMDACIFQSEQGCRGCAYTLHIIFKKIVVERRIHFAIIYQTKRGAWNINAWRPPVSSVPRYLRVFDAGRSFEGRTRSARLYLISMEHLQRYVMYYCWNSEETNIKNDKSYIPPLPRMLLTSPLSPLPPMFA